LVALRAVGVAGLNLDVEHFHASAPPNVRQFFVQLVCGLKARLEVSGGDPTPSPLPLLPATERLCLQARTTILC
jgi:hypothetical protein